MKQIPQYGNNRSIPLDQKKGIPENWYGAFGPHWERMDPRVWKIKKEPEPRNFYTSKNVEALQGKCPSIQGHFNTIESRKTHGIKLLTRTAQQSSKGKVFIGEDF